MKKILFLFSLSLSLLLVSCVKDEIYKSAPVIKLLSISPQSPAPGQSVAVTAIVFDVDGMVTARLYYKVDNGSINAIELTATNDTLYTGNIPGQGDGVTVTYYLEAQGKSGKKGFAPAGAPGTMAAYTIGAPLVLMNEIYSRGTIGDPDWIEIYNASDVPADISGYTIYDNGGQSGSRPKKSIPSGTVIPAKGFYVINTEGTGDPSDFGLSSAGETVWLENAKGNVIDQIAFPAMDVTQSYGRSPDGSANWQLLNTITKGSSNGTGGTPVAQFVINEIFSVGTADNPDWIEIYNKSNFEGSLRNWKIFDNGGQGGTKPKLQFPDDAIVPAGGFYVIVVDNGTAAGFGLSSAGETVWLEKPDGSLADEVAFPALTASQSYGRYPDGTTNWSVINSVTRGAANADPNPPVIRLVMNEIYSRGTTTDPDWIEIYNDSDVPVNLDGWKIYDNGGQGGTKPKKGFPTGATIAARGFYVITTEGSGDPSDFGLSSAGETVWFEKPDGTLADQIAFPAMEVTQSYGRKPDGSANWQLLNTITKGTSNNNAK